MGVECWLGSGLDLGRLFPAVCDETLRHFEFTSSHPGLDDDPHSWPGLSQTHNLLIFLYRLTELRAGWPPGKVPRATTPPELHCPVADYRRKA